MELDHALLEKLMGLSDVELSDAVTRVALGLGLDESLLKPYLEKTDQIRAAMANLSPADLDRVAAVIGEERLKETICQLDREAGQK